RADAHQACLGVRGRRARANAADVHWEHHYGQHQWHEPAAARPAEAGPRTAAPPLDRVRRRARALLLRERAERTRLVLEVRGCPPVPARDDRDARVRRDLGELRAERRDEYERVGVGDDDEERLAPRPKQLAMV